MSELEDEDNAGQDDDVKSVRSQQSDGSHKDKEASQLSDTSGDYEMSGIDSGMESQLDGAYDFMHGSSQVDLNAITEVQDEKFEEIKLPDDTIQEVQETWAAFIGTNREAACDALYGALFEAAPSLQGLFKTPRAVMAIKIMNGFNTIVSSMHQPGPLKITVETFGFQHLDFEITVPRVVIFRDAIVDLLEMELGGRFTTKAKIGWKSILNYVGGAFIYVRVHYTDRLKIIASSWAVANNKKVEVTKAEDAIEEAAVEDGEGEVEDGALAEALAEDFPEEPTTAMVDPAAVAGPTEGAGAPTDSKNKALKVPTTFNEMFVFNSAVMGFGNSLWMQEVLESFDAMVCNVANSYRLQEECDTLSLRLSKYKGQINLAEFKAVMLASLRSMVPADWGSAHEVAWTWLWSNVERMLKSMMGKPKVMAKALERLIMSLTEESQNYLRRELYKRFFTLAPAGQDFFKQSTTRLYWIADKVVEMTLEMYKEPRKMVEVISAVGLRHVGYGVSVEFFPPYVTGAVEVVRSMTSDDTAEEGFRWSLSLMARILVRTINEGSTIVMKAINTNSGKQLRRALTCAPRGERAMWMLNITVGTQSISPLYWSIESGSLEAANAMLADLLIIRADRDNYYYGCDDLFSRHPDVVRRLCADAEGLVPTLLDGLIWRSRVTANSFRRVNYYIKHMLLDHKGRLSKNLEWLADHEDPKIVCHPVVVLFSDLLWSRVASRYFIYGRCWFLFTLAIFVCSQSILQRIDLKTDGERSSVFILRVFIYLGSLGPLLRGQLRSMIKDIRFRRFVHISGIPIPDYLGDSKEVVTFLLVCILIFMLCTDPILRCLQDNQVEITSSDANGVVTTTTANLLFTQDCAAGRAIKKNYSIASMIAMLCYWFVVTDLSILSTRISAFVLVCSRVLPEVLLFICAIIFFAINFATSIKALNSLDDRFDDIGRGILTLTEITFGMFPMGGYKGIAEDSILLTSVAVFVVIAIIFLMSLLVAQLNCAYKEVYHDMVGYARLNRGKVICDTMRSVSQDRWTKFVTGLRFDERLEFNEGDIGLAGGIQVLEPANANPTTVDMIRRFGGTTAPSQQWPEDDLAYAGADDESKFEKLEKAIVRTTKSIGTGGGGGPKKKAGATSGLDSDHSMADDDDE
jgi:hemoglobin-like flavoprotein